MRSIPTAHGLTSIRAIKAAPLSHAGVLALGLALATGSSPALAQATIPHKILHQPGPQKTLVSWLFPTSAPEPAPRKILHKRVHKEAEPASKEPFGEIPKGPLQIFVSINQQELHLYSNGVHIADAQVATGVPGHSTPMGVFSIIEKDRYHHSNLYSNAPMPYMQRITWSGVALHEGPGVGRPASHGCIRMPREFAARLWLLTRLGARVIIARQELKPTEFSDSHLFVHKDPQSPTAAAVTAPVKTAQSVDATTRTDVGGDPPVGRGGDGSRAPLLPTPAAGSGTTAMVMPIVDLAADTPAILGKAMALDTAAMATPAPTQPAEAAHAPASPPGLRAEARMAASPAADGTNPVAGPADDIPIPLSKPAEFANAGNGPIAIFVSRKDGKIFVRQNFAPLFEAPITIQQRDRPLGTHVFTAMGFLDDGITLRWTVVSLPGEEARAAREGRYEIATEERPRRGRHHHEAEPDRVVAAPVETPLQTLARLEIPRDVIEQISELIVPGSSLIVSDHGLGSETGEGTDFIVITR